MAAPAYPLRLPAGAAQPLITLTKPTASVWQLELHSTPDNRITRALVEDALKPALDAVEREWRAASRAAKAPKKLGAEGALVIVGRRGQEKFFSNGFDYESVIADPNWFPVVFNPLLARLITFPIPTVAAINGHCFAAGLILSLACDYRVFTSDASPKRNAWLCMNEVHFGAPWPLAFAALLRAKVRDARVQRRVALEGHRFTPAQALEAGLVDEVVEGGTEAVLGRAVALAGAQAGNARLGAWGLIRGEVHRDVVEATKLDYRAVHPAHDDAAAKARL
ncbi:ClpP/crotonase [Dentipellis sp. KUC8613]|nr:ClpP/crotonase [Dentipellis sp. KUC8613]